MTYVMNTPSSSLNSNRKLKYFSVEVITFNGDSFMDEIEARSSEEAEKRALDNKHARAAVARQIILEVN